VTLLRSLLEQAPLVLMHLAVPGIREGPCAALVGTSKPVLVAELTSRLLMIVPGGKGSEDLKTHGALTARKVWIGGAQPGQCGRHGCPRFHL
jgi:hypothetical protein